MSLISKLAKMSAVERNAYLAEQAAAADVLAQKATNIANARAAVTSALETLETETDAAIAALETAAAARAETLTGEIAARHGVDVATIKGRSSLSGTTVAVRYRNPADHNQTWTGRGREPLWIAAIGGLSKCEDLRPKADVSAAA